MKIKIKESLSLLYITLFITLINGQMFIPIDNEEFDSMRWFVNQYRLGDPFNTSLFCSDSLAKFISCTKVNDRYHIESIRIPASIDINYDENAIPLPPLFKLPYLYSYDYEATFNPVDPSVNILEMVASSPKLVFITIFNDTSITKMPTFKSENITQIKLFNVGTISDISNLKESKNLATFTISSPMSFNGNSTFPYVHDMSVTLIPGIYSFDDEHFQSLQSLTIATISGEYLFTFNSSSLEKITITGIGKMKVSFLNTAKIDTLEINKNYDSSINFNGNSIPKTYTLNYDYATIDSVTYEQVNNGYFFTILGSFNLTKPASVTVNQFPCLLNDSSTSNITCQTGDLANGMNELVVNINQQIDKKQIDIEPKFPIIYSVNEVGKTSLIFNGDIGSYQFSFKGNFGPEPQGITNMTISNKPCVVSSVSSSELICSVNFTPGRNYASVALSIGKFKYYANTLLFFYSSYNFTCGHGEFVDGACKCDDGYAGFRCDAKLANDVVLFKHIVSNANYFNFFVGDQVYQYEMTTITEMNIYGATLRIFKPTIMAVSGAEFFFNVYDETGHKMGNINIITKANNQYELDFLVTDYTYKSIASHLRVSYRATVSSQSIPDNDECNQFVYTDYKFFNPDQEYFRIAQGQTAMMVDVSKGIDSNNMNTYYFKTYASVNKQSTVVYFDFPYCNYCLQPMTITLLKPSDTYRSECEIHPPKYWNLFIYLPLTAIIVVGILIIVLFTCKRKIFTNTDRFFDFE